MEEYTFKTKKWTQVALFNFCVVAFAGITLRYKINFSLPVIDQKYLLHAHSHFAFTGWVSLILMILMVNYLQKQKVLTNYKKYYWIFWANCITAYGMLFSFIVQGYALFSITFSTLSIFVSYFFIYSYWKDLVKVKDESYAPYWFKAALIIWGISSLGAFTLAYLMANHINVQDYYFAAIYFFLHFQYNGWFLFACFGLLFSYLSHTGVQISLAAAKNLFLAMVITVGPTYFLSILWLKLPYFLHLVADVSGVSQTAILFCFAVLLFKRKQFSTCLQTTKWLWTMAAIAFMLKIILQMLSIIPVLSSYAFAFRPIVIGYLHLIFSVIVSFFIIGYINEVLSETQNAISKTAVMLFVAGVILQEFVLMCQGLETFAFSPLPYASIVLFYAAIVIGVGLFWLTWSTKSAGNGANSHKAQ